MAEDLKDLNQANVDELPDLNALPTRSERETGTPPATPSTKEGENQPPESSPEGEVDRVDGQEEAQSPTGDEQASAKPKEEGTPSPEGEEEVKPPESTEGEEAKETAPISTDQQNTLLSEMTKGRVDTQEDLVAVLDHYERQLDFIDKVQKKPLEIFPENSRERKVAEFLMKQPGENFQGDIQKFHHVQGLGDVKDLSPRQAQFEAYMLKEENADLSREDGKKYFDAKYEKIYGEDIEALKEDDPLLYREHEVESNKARKQISDMQTEFQSETSANTFGQQQQQPAYSPEEQAEFEGEVDAALDDYAGLSISFDSDAKPEDRINFVLDDPSDREQFTEYLKDPRLWWDDVLSKHMDAEGNFDSEGYVDDLLIRMYPEKAMEVMFRQGIEKGKIMTEEGIKNVSSGGEAGSTPEAEKKGFVETWADAMG